MKTGKKLLSVLLSLIMIVSTVSISFTTFTVSAVDGNDLKSAFSKITDASLTNGDGTMLNAAEVLYQYVYGIADPRCNGVGGNGNGATVSPVGNNSSVDLNVSAKNAAPGYDAIINSLIPTAGVTDDSAASRQNGSEKRYNGAGSIGFDEGWVKYNIGNDVNHSVTVSADIQKILLTYGSLGAVPQSILTSVTYNYNNALRRGYARHSKDKKKVVLIYREWFWSSLSWQSLSQKPTRTNVVTDETAYQNLHAFADWFTDSRTNTSVNDLAKLSASEINALNA